MSWLFWLAIATVVALVAAVTGIKPGGTRPVAHTRMMAIGRFFLFLLIAVLLYLAYRSSLGDR